MNRFVFSIIASLVFCASPAGAQNSDNTTDTLHLGYCNGEYNQVPDLASNGKGYAEAAVRFSRETLSSCKGNSIVGVRAALAERINTDTLRVWVRSKLDGENIAEGYVLRNGAGGINKGWNSVMLDQPLDINDSTGDIYVGYSLHHKATVKAVSLLPQPIDNTSFVKLNKTEWTDYSDKGTVCVEAIVAGNNFLDYDLGLGVATVVPEPAQGDYAVKTTVQIHNYGVRAVKGFGIKLTADGNTAQTAHFDNTIAAFADTIVTFVADMGTPTDIDTKWTLQLDGIDGAEDMNGDNNTTVPTYKFARNVLVEEFTTERCSNCPRAAGFLHTTLAEDRFKDRVFAVTHHSGYYTDWLTQPCDNELTWFYDNGGSTYAPAMMFDRYPYFENSKGNPSPMTSVGSLELVEAACLSEMERSANAMLGLKLEFNADSTQLLVDVAGLCTSLYNTTSPRVCLYLLENDIKAQSQAGADGVYMQQHVNRAYNSTWGEPVEWKDRRFGYSYTFDIDPSWIKKNMEVVAFVYNADFDNPANCIIDNAASSRLVDESGETAIRDINHDSKPTVVAAYSLNGSQVYGNGSQHGVVIERMSDGSTRKVVR